MKVHQVPAGRQIVTITWTGDDFLTSLMAVNVWLLLFNLIPAFPMDGGRVLRALLAKRLEYMEATQSAARVGQGMALVFGFLGLFYDPFLIFIAFFVWMGASAEAGLVQARSSLGGIPVQRVMLINFHTLQPDEPLAQAVDQILAGWQQDFAVVFGDHVLGILTREDLVRAIARGETGCPCAMRCDVTSRPWTRTTCWSRPSRSYVSVAAAPLPVQRNGELVGMLSLENVGEFIMIHSAIRQSKVKMQAAKVVV